MLIWWPSTCSVWKHLQRLQCHTHPCWLDSTNSRSARFTHRNKVTPLHQFTKIAPLHKMTKVTCSGHVIKSKQSHIRCGQDIVLKVKKYITSMYVLSLPCKHCWQSHKHCTPTAVRRETKNISYLRREATNTSYNSIASNFTDSSVILLNSEHDYW